MSHLLPERLCSAGVIPLTHPLASATIIKADNAFEYIERVREDHSILVNIAPPLDNLFVQWAIEPGIDVGIHIMSERVREGELFTGWRLVAGCWTVPNVHRFAEKKALIVWITDVDASGKLVSISTEWNERFWKHHTDQKQQGWNSLVVGALFAINLMNCRNVILEEQPVSRREQRMAAHGKPVYRYHILKVRPTSKIRVSEDDSTKRGEYAAHICRGHFKTFTDEAPLFGRFTGTYWWESQVRGRDKDHFVDKDYQVVDE